MFVLKLHPILSQQPTSNILWSVYYRMYSAQFYSRARCKYSILSLFVYSLVHLNCIFVCIKLFSFYFVSFVVIFIFSVFFTPQFTVRTPHLAPRSQHPAPRTPHPAPRTPHPAPRTPHPAPRTPHPAPRTPHPAPRTPHPAPRTPHPAPRTPHPAPRTPHPAPRILHPGVRFEKTDFLISCWELIFAIFWKSRSNGTNNFSFF